MTYEKAKEVLRTKGWNEDGADAIVTTLDEDGMLEGLTEAELIAISDDYADR